ncbi:toll/interleukin-1 receptor domain-containing protein [uncultured Psychrobacter sp.]|uniref:toll/interleukin-1 receptor domain-containing protein n=1 Tax=uncultured Psychrobacter sp. TaxID=259303 RepID=UPI00262C93AD|nr:toll/interleukin-1 receptor domain-containing protein [uncultured Psychrobacter sp.]
MSVFISYRHTDRNTAAQIAREFDANNIKYYFDVTDDESRSTEDITEVITKNIKKSTHLLAIVSPSTTGSWWVPFEIGQATISNRRICSYAVKNSSLNLSGMSFSFLKGFLPEYLQKWPILVSRIDLHKFIEQYKLDTITVSTESARGGIFESQNEKVLTKAGASNFHQSLKREL